MTDQNTGAVGTADTAAGNVDALRAENEALRSQLADQPQTAASKGGGWRSVLAWILVVLAILSVVLSVFAVWLKTTITDEDRFVATFAALPEQEEVVVALSVRLADEIVVAAGVEESLSSALPTQIAFLAAPVAEGVSQLTSEVAREVIASDIFAGVWRAALRVSHAAVATVLETEGRIAIDLDEAAQTVVDELADRGITAFEGQEVDVPEIVLFESEQIAAVAGVVNFIDTMAWFLPLLSLVLIVAAIWASLDRRKTVSFLGFGTAFALLLDLAILRIIRANSVGNIEEEISRAAGQAGWDSTFRFYTGGVWAVIALALVVGTVAWVLGPSERAQRTRTAWTSMLARWSGSDVDEPRSDFEEFVIKWKSVIQWGAVALGLLFIMFGPAPTFWTVTFTAVVVLVIFGAAQAIAGPASAAPAAETAPDDGNGPEEKVGAGTAPHA
jgi:hypothetical protein